VNGRRDLLLAVSASLIVGCAIGLIAGVLFARVVLSDHHLGPPFGRVPSGRHGGPMVLPLRGIARQLELSREQEARVDSILRESRVQLDSLRRETRTALLRELTPEQRERWERLDRRMLRPGGRHGGPGDGEPGGPGGPGPPPDAP
jgi:Spy/CpxP family protein refolding chaperone